MAEAKPRHNDDDSGNRRLTRTKAKVEATESRRLTRAKNQKDKVINQAQGKVLPRETGANILTAFSNIHYGKVTKFRKITEKFSQRFIFWMPTLHKSNNDENQFQ